jgi:hypothetical protein
VLARAAAARPLSRFVRLAVHSCCGGGGGGGGEREQQASDDDSFLPIFELSICLLLLSMMSALRVNIPKTRASPLDLQNPKKTEKTISAANCRKKTTMMNHPLYRRTNDAPLPGPTVYRLASERRYGEIPSHVESNPQDIYWADRYGSTALHVLCCSRQVGDPLSRAIESILQRDSTLVGRPNEASWTPLHLACEKRLLWRANVATGDLALRLIAACPEAVSMRLQNGYRAKTPFHIACETNAVLSVLQAMLRAEPSLVTQSYHTRASREIPLELIWKAQWNDQRPTSLGESLAKMEVLLRAAFCGTIMDASGNEDATDPFPIACAVCSIRCPRDYVSRILMTHSGEIPTPNPKTGYLPLHYAILTTEEDDPTAYTSFLIERVVEEYPAAALVPFRQGSQVLPLHVLIADRFMTWHKGGVQYLALASTDVLKMPDPRSRLVPALESAVHAHTSRMHLSTTYELLRLAPEVVSAGFSSASLST